MIFQMGAVLRDFHYGLMGLMNLNPFLFNLFEMEDWIIMAPFIIGALVVNHRLLFYPILFIILIRPRRLDRGMVFWSIGIWLLLMLTSGSM
jgi:hypothetical protein